MAVQIKEALTVFTGKRALEHLNTEVRSSFVIAKLIRDGFAHQPLQPVWMIDKKYKNQKYKNI
jgi:hypothetical protein